MRKKIFKIVLWSLLGLFLLCSTGVAVGVYWVLTPERLTATLRSQLKSMLLCKSDIGSVEVKLFAGYKVLSVEIRDVVLRNKMDGADKDTILFSKRGYLQVDWLKWWKYDQLDIQKVSLEQPRLYYFVNSKGKTNWDIFPPDTTTKSSTTAMPFKEARLPLFEVIHANLVYRDIPGKMEARVNALDFNLTADFKKSELAGQLTCKTPRMLVKMDNEEMWKGYPLEVKTQFRYWTDLFKVHFESLQLASGNIKIQLNGDVQGDSLFQTWKMKLNARLDLPQIHDVIERIPASMDDALAGIQVSGKGSVEGMVTGVYGPKQMPEIDFAIDAPQIQVNMADFADMPIEISDARMRIYGDLDHMDLLKMDVKSVTAKLLNSVFTGQGELSQLTNQMHFSGNVQGKMHMQTISGHFLDTLGYHVLGNILFDTQMDLSMEALLKQDWKNIHVNGKADYTDLLAQSTADTLLFRSPSGHVDLELHPQTNDGKQWFMDMKGFVNGGAVEMQGKQTARFEHLNIDTKTSNFMDSTQSLEAAVVMNLKDILVPQNALQTASPPQDIRIPQCRLDMLWTPEQSELHEAHLEMMGSDVNMTGQLKHFSRYLLGKEKLWGRLNIQSNQLDLGALAALGTAWGVVETPGEQKTKENVQPKKDTAIVTTGPFMLPDDMDLEMHLNVKSALYGASKWGHILGAVTLKNGKLLLDKLKVSLPAGQVQLTALYRTPRKNHLFAGFDFHMVQVEMDELIRMIPNVDSIMPMLRSFSGKAEFHMVGETYMDSLYNLKKSTLRGAASIAGQNLVLKDGHEFTEIARTLKFSKKNRILVDSLSAELTLFKNEVDVFPFQISMENYKAVISGRHNLDMSFNYHISVTDSPLPFRLGVDVYGNMKDMHFRLAPVKYGYRYRPSQQHTVETQVLNLRKMIKASLAEGPNQE